jgi:aspartate aminotransferase
MIRDPAHGEPGQPQVRPRVQDLPASQIRALANAGFGKPDQLNFWFGESDRPTPGYIRDAAISALQTGRTYYTHNNGIADLRAAVAGYVGGLHGCSRSSSEISITSSGVSALMIAMQAIVDPGDRVVVVTPVWPNVAEIPRILSAEVVRCPLMPTDAGWRLDLDLLLEMITPQTRLLVLNSPGNPTGWVLPREHRLPILDHCRRLGVWLLSDDVYERLTFDDDAGHSASFLALTDPGDRVISANSFSKAWLMTGWRLGWIVAPRALEGDLGKLIEFNTSCAPDFIQAAGLAAINQGEPYVRQLRSELLERRNTLLTALRGLDGVHAPVPAGGMYGFFRIEGQARSVDLAGRLVAEAGLGLAPGAAFGPEGEGWLRWCFAADERRLQDGIARLTAWLPLRRR